MVTAAEHMVFAWFDEAENRKQVVEIRALLSADVENPDLSFPFVVCLRKST